MFFNIFINDIDSSECILSKFADDTKLGWATDTIEGRYTIQSDLDMVKKWTHETLMRLNKAKYNVLELGQGNPRYEYRLVELTESSPGEKAEQELAACSCSLESQQYPGLNQKIGSQEGEGADCHPLLCLLQTPSEVLCPGLGPPVEEGHEDD